MVSDRSYLFILNALFSFKNKEVVEYSNYDCFDSITSEEIQQYNRFLPISKITLALRQIMLEKAIESFESKHPDYTNVELVRVQDFKIEEFK